MAVFSSPPEYSPFKRRGLHRRSLRILFKHIQAQRHMSSQSTFSLPEVHWRGAAPKRWIHKFEKGVTDAVPPARKVPGHPAGGHSPFRQRDGERARAGQGAQTLSCLLVMKDQKTDGKTLQHAFFGTKTSDDLKKLFSKPSLSSVLKGGLDSG